MAVIDNSVVRILPDFTGFKTKLKAELKTATTGVEGKVRVVADLTGFKGSFTKAFKDAGLTAKVRLEASAVGFQRSINEAIKGPGGTRFTAKVRLVADSAGFQRDASQNIDKLRRDTESQSRASVKQFAADETEKTAVVERELTKRQRAAASQRTDPFKSLEGPKFIDWGGEGFRPMNLLVGAAVALSPALIAVASSAAQASTAVASLGAAGLGAIAGVSALWGALSGLGDAMKLAESVRVQGLQKATKIPGAAIKTAAQQVADARQIGAAQRGITNAERDLNAARTAVAEAQRKELDAQKAINDVRREALRDLQDLRDAVHDLGMDEEQAALDLQDARAKQMEVNHNYWASERDKAQAALDVRQAEDKLADTQRERARKTVDLADAEKKGVNGSAKVKQAVDQAASAHTAVASAQATVLDRQDALTAAHEQLATAQGKSTTALQQQAAATNVLSAADAQLRDKLAHETQEFRDLFYFLKDVGRPALDGFRHRMQKVIDPAVLQFLKDLGIGSKDNTTLFAMFSKTAENHGKIIARVIGQAGRMSKEPWFKDGFTKIAAESEKSTEHFGNAAIDLIKPMMRIFEDAAPLLTRFSIAVENTTKRFAKFIEQKHNSGELAEWFRKAGDEFALWVDLAKQVGKLLLPIFRESLPTGNNLVTRLRDFIKTGADWAASDKGRDSIRHFFETFRNLPYGDIAKTLASMVTLFLTYRGLKFTAENPWRALITVLVATDPAKFATLVNLLADGLLPTLKWIGENPGLPVTLMAMFAAMKTAKSFNLGIKLPGVDNLKKYLVGKFSWLEGITGLKSQTAVMHVTAGTVNLTGAVKGGGLDTGTGTGAGGEGGVIGEKGAKVSAGSKAKELAKKLGKGGLFALVASMIGDEIIDTVVPETQKDGSTVKDRVNAAMKGALAGGGALAFFGPIGMAIGAVGGGVAAAFEPELKKVFASKENGPAGPSGPTLTPGGMIPSTPVKLTPAQTNSISDNYYKQRTAAQRERETFSWIGKSIDTSPGGKNRIITTGTRDTIAGSKGLQDYIKYRKENVQLGYDTIKTAEGEAEAEKWRRQENDKSINTLKQTLMQFGYTTDAADAYAKAVYGQTSAEQGLAAQQQNSTQPNLDTTGQKTDTARGKTDNLTKSILAIPTNPVVTPDFDPVGTAKKRSEALKADISAIIGRQVIDVDLVPGSDVDKKLEQYNIQQMALKNGGDFQLAKNQYAKDKRLAMRFADGGPVGGFSPHPRADNIPTWLTAKEWVMPVKSVDKYGPKMMASLQKGTFPAFADGGQAKPPNKWPFFLGLPDMVLGAGAGAGAFGGPLGGGGGGIGWQWELNALKAGGFDFHPKISQLTGGKHARNSWHYKGRAVDLSPPTEQVFNWIAAKYGARSQELFYSPMPYYIKHGRKIPGHFPDHYDHVHWAFANGGQVPTFDSGGILGPGLNLVNNATGGPEPLVPAGATNRLDPRDIALLAAHIARAVAGQHIRMDGRQVAETVTGYNYLPGTF